MNVLRILNHQFAVTEASAANGMGEGDLKEKRVNRRND